MNDLHHVPGCTCAPEGPLDAVDDGQWSVAEVADYLEVQPSTVTAYVAREQMPKPDGRLGRTPWWWADTIRAWDEQRPKRHRK